jgi:DNA-binding transcriptional ArsR family regulator
LGYVFEREDRPGEHGVSSSGGRYQASHFTELSSKGEQTVHALTRFAGVSQPAVSKHLSVLKQAKLVRHRRNGRETHSMAQPEALEPIMQWLRDNGAFWEDRFDRLESLLERIDREPS